MGLEGSAAVLQKGMNITYARFDCGLTILWATELTPPDADIEALYNYSYNVSAHGDSESPAKISFPEFQYPDMCKWLRTLARHWLTEWQFRSKMRSVNLTCHLSKNPLLVTPWGTFGHPRPSTARLQQGPARCTLTTTKCRTAKTSSCSLSTK